ncbi:hypothetical protein X928_01895 [Petrotoga miotherma DSM 10691]|uniref:CRISPR-associated protein Csx11 n=1 Tax=Petrotoga miotherma DSM 10691 TaxID=1434326 RepID=A0A2K1PGA3_9BACT|nr:CRISPR-associated protein Csx11 [Petrotoga miotherma]PNS01834.1 hypothetical protein X928_01895 [Petrotoga miotherma DSM 10691]
MYFEKIKSARQNILTGEIGALLHDIGKCHPNFVKTKSKENIRGLPHHARDIDKFLDDYLVRYIKDEKFKFKINNIESGIYSLITKHHDKDEDLKDPKYQLVKLLKTCDHKDSADDKGIVRRQQGLDNTIISSPFGYQKEKIDLTSLQKRFDDLQDNLKGLFKNYIYDELDLSCFRKGLLNNLKTTFSHALGETRIPSNDVTLWDHSYSTASLFKSVLCEIALDEEPDPGELQWRALGFCWDGIGFINKGKKIADILKRNEIIEETKIELKEKFEDEIPIGNAIYEDINGVYFTFPTLKDDNAKELAKECAEESLKILRDKSDNEIWPFFTLSKPSRTLTILSSELKSAAEKRDIPKMSPMLFVENGEKQIGSNPDIPLPETDEDRKDVCPVCRMRTKPVSNERCDICEKRRKGRLQDWFNNRENTIWTDEVADKNNRVALLSLNFNLDKWLDGTMIGTIFSQTFEEWLNKAEEPLHEVVEKWKKEIRNDIDKKEETIKNMEKAKLKESAKKNLEKFIKGKEELEKQQNQLTFVLKPQKEVIYKLLGLVLNWWNTRSQKSKDNDKQKIAKILDTFFEDIKVVSDKDKNGIYIEDLMENLRLLIEPKPFNVTNLQRWFFTQNPSPARIYRIWKETEEFFELIIKEIINKIYSNKWGRLKFSIDNNNLKSKLKQGEELKENTPYLIKKEELNPQNLLVLHTKNGEFYTIESLDKFKSEDETGENAVCEALKQGFNYLALEDKPNENLLKEEIEPNNIKTEEYIPLIEINKSPLSLRMIVPASDAIKILELISKLYNERFEKVLGKLPLNAKLLVTNRKFPLYVLLDAEKRMLAGSGFTKAIPTNIWWNVDSLRNEGFYGYYSIKKREEGKYTLDDLSSLSKGKIYQILPGYFDFELLLGTTDRYNIYYEGENRGDRDYKLFSKRPYYQYQFSELLELWDILTANISTSQINFIEESFITKLREWRNIEDNNKEDIFKEFAVATLEDAFGKKWDELSEETRFLLINSSQNKALLDTIILFRHILKEGVEEK